ncbi:MAG: patatin-like phospholipase family protein [Planctomycetes bacterium]|nr:patatin-like phospholipase family protein [Planctomycetota bacterium]
MRMRGTVLLLLLLAAAGCTHSRKCTLEPSPAACRYDPLAPGNQAEQQARQASLSKGFQELYRSGGLDPNAYPNILVLSGGGQNGAFGAGIMNGWTGHGRPAFHVVTGISTGSLISTFAFLGRREDDEALRECYTQTGPSDIYVHRPIFVVPFSDSLSVMRPLRKLLEHQVNNDVIKLVGAEYSKGRRLFVGTVDMDHGTLKVWDMTEIAAGSEPGRFDRYRSILRAAAAIPVLFEPEMIDGNMHVDGGVREQLFLRDIVCDLCDALGTARKARGLPAAPHPGAAGAAGPGAKAAPTGPRPTIYVINNGKIGVKQHCVGDGILPILLRSVELLLDEGQVGSMYKIYALAQEHGYDYKLDWIPSCFPLESASEDFNTADMRRLFALGLERGQAGGVWATEPPPDNSHDHSHGAAAAAAEGGAAHTPEPGAAPAVGDTQKH